MTETNTTDTPSIDIGQVHPEQPTFRVIARREMFLVDEATWAMVRPCAHKHLILDDGMATVTCGDCGERLDAYSIVRRYAEFSEELTRRVWDARHREQAALVADCRRMLKRVCFTDADRERYGRRLTMFGSDKTLEAVREAHREISERVREDKATRRAKRRTKRPAAAR